MEIINKGILNSPIYNNLNALLDTTYYADLEGRVQEIYGSWLQLNAYNISKVTGKTLGEFFNSNSPDIHQERFNQCLKNGKVVYEWSFKNLNKTFYFQSALTRIQFNGSYGVVGIIREITRQKEIELFYRELELSFKALTNSANYGIISINENKAIEYLNPAVSVITGYSEDELQGNEIDQIFYKSSDFYNFLESYIKNKFFTKNSDINIQPVEILISRKDKKIIPTEITLSSYEIFNVTHFVILIQDITLRKNAENELLISKEKLKIQNKTLEETLHSLRTVQDQLIHSEKMASIGQITASIAQEINNLLAFVSSNIFKIKEYFNDIIPVLDKWQLFDKSVIYTDELNERLNEILETEKKIDLNFIRKDFSDLMKYNLEGIERIKNIVRQLQSFSYSGN